VSDLSQPRECGEWIQAWEGEIRLKEPYNAEATARWISKLEDMISFFSSGIQECERTGRWPSCWKPDDVRMSLAMLQEAQKRAIEKAVEI
jgi:hypothetical protein